MAKRTNLSLTDFNQMKQQIQASLDSSSDGDMKKRLQICIDNIGHLSEETSQRNLLTRFVYCIAALEHEMRYGGLGDNKINQIAEMAYGIIQSLDYPTSSKMTTINADLNFVLSDLYAQKGWDFQAIWSQGLANRNFRALNTNDDYSTSYALSSRLLRKGFGESALKHLEEALNQAQTKDQIARVELLRLRILRLQGHLQQARRLEKTLSKYTLSQDQQEQLQWQNICRIAQETGNLLPMTGSIKPNNAHYSGTHVIECFYWVYAHQSKRYLTRISKARSIARNPSLSTNRLGRFIKLAQTIEEFSNSEISFEVRLRNVGKALEHVDQFLSIDKKLLAWAMTARVLASHNALELSSIALDYYRNTCMSLSGGSNCDTLNLMSDLFERSWFDPQLPTKKSA